MKAVVVDYSRYGHTRVVAEEIARTLDADRRQIRAKKEHGYPLMGFAALFGIPFAIEPMDMDFSSFDLVVLCTPIWAGRPASPTREFLRHAKLDGKRLSIALSTWGGPTQSVVDKIKTDLRGQNVTLTPVESIVTKDVPDSQLRASAHAFAERLAAEVPSPPATPDQGPGL